MGVAGLRLHVGAELASAPASSTAGRPPRGKAPMQGPPRSWTSRSMSVGVSALRPRRLLPTAARRPVPGGRKVVAMVNVDLSPSTILGSGMVVAGLSLWQIRASKPELSKDKDVVFSSVGVLVGGILIFQGWRLDPLLLFGQLLTVSTALSFAMEAVNLRQQISDKEGPGMLPYEDDYSRAQGDGFYRQEPRPLPPPRATEFSSLWDDDRFDSRDSNRGVYDVTPEAAYDYYDEGGYSEQQSGGRFRGGPGASSGPGPRDSRYYEDDSEFPDQWESQPETVRGSSGSSSRPWAQYDDQEDLGQEGGYSGGGGFGQTDREDYGRGYDDDFGSQQPPPPPRDSGSSNSSSNGSRGRPRPSSNNRRNQDDDLMDDWGV